MVDIKEGAWRRRVAHYLLAEALESLIKAPFSYTSINPYVHPTKGKKPCVGHPQPSLSDVCIYEITNTTLFHFFTYQNKNYMIIK